MSWVINAEWNSGGELQGIWSLTDQSSANNYETGNPLIA